MNTELNKMEICDMKVQTVKKDIKNMHLGVYPPQGRIRVAAPSKMDDESIRLFIVSKIPWIRKQKVKFERQLRQTRREFVSGESHYFFGNRYRLNVIFTNETPRIEIIRKSHINLYVSEDMSRDERNKMFDRFYREELRKRLSPIIDKWESETGLEINDLRIRKMKTKWGSCNPNKKRIWINLELAKKPLRCVEYVLVHEMIHFLERKHSDRFLYYLDRFVPNWKFLKEELNNFPLSYDKWESVLSNNTL